MPIFDYVCPACTNTREVIVQRADDPVFCPPCGERMVRQFPNRPPRSEIKGFREANGYSNSDAHPRPSRYKGITTSVKS